MNTPTLYTRNFVIESYKKRCRLFNEVEKRLNPSLKLTDGLTEQDIKVVGDLMLSLPEPDKSMRFSLLYANEPLGIGA